MPAISGMAARRLAEHHVVATAFGPGRRRVACPRVQTSICSAMASASSISTPKYLTVVSTLTGGPIFLCRTVARSMA